MKKKVVHTKNKTREENSFPYLSMSIKQRLIASGSVDITEKFSVKEEGGYWAIQPKDPKKKIN